jgi:type IV secretory pathway TraG/TraD family ATPase VirD4
MHTKSTNIQIIIRFLTCSYIFYTSTVFSYCLCLVAWPAADHLGHTLLSSQVSSVHACVSYPGPAAAAAAVVVVVAVAAAETVAVAAVIVLRAEAAEVEDLGRPHDALLAVVVVV